MKLAICLLSTLAAAASSQAQELRAGTAQVVITPPTGTPMAGYYHARGADGVLDPLCGKALVMRAVENSEGRSGLSTRPIS